MNTFDYVTRRSPTRNGHFARARTLQAGRRLIDTINRIRIAAFAKCGCNGRAGYTLTDPFPTPSAPRNSHIVSRMEPRRSGSGKTVSSGRERPISPSLRYFPPPRPTFRDLTRAKDRTPSWGRLLYTLARSASSLKLNGPLRSLRLLDGRRAILRSRDNENRHYNYEKLLCHHTDDDNDNNNVMKKKTQAGEFVFARLSTSCFR